MKKILAVLSIALLAAIGVQAQTGLNQVPNLMPGEPTVSGALADLKTAIFGRSNGVVEVHALYAKGLSSKYGGGIGYFWNVNPYLLGGVRLDYVDGGFYMPSGNATLQLPTHPLKSLTFLPKWASDVELTYFGYGGVGIPLSGAKVYNFTVPGHIKNNAGQATAILGMGAAVKVATAHGWEIFAIADRETWSGFNGAQWRFGALAKIHIPEK